jgi:hypothetical protein
VRGAYSRGILSRHAIGCCVTLAACSRRWSVKIQRLSRRAQRGAMVRLLLGSPFDCQALGCRL